MALELTKETKNALSLTSEAKVSPIWDEDLETWDDSVGTWDQPGVVLHAETKNALSLSNETKNV